MCGKVSVLLTYADEELEGMVIVAEGVNDMDIKSDVITAAEVVTGLGKHKIKVYEMKVEDDESGKEVEHGQN